jgi:calcium-dependent protein kinase
MDHPSVLKIFEYFQDDDRLYLVTEYVPHGELLQEMNKKKGTKEIHFNEEEAALIIKQVLIVINYLHNTNIVHRDIKPDNILIESKPDEEDPHAPW